MPIEADGKYKIGQVFKLNKERPGLDWRLLKFDGLEIKNIDYFWGVRLHFDWNEWETNKGAI